MFYLLFYDIQHLRNDRVESSSVCLKDFLRNSQFFLSPSQRLIRMNMPVGGDQTVTFHSTLFALIRTSLDIKMKGNMFKNDQELRRAIQLIWPNMPKRNVDKILPKQTGKRTFYCATLKEDMRRNNHNDSNEHNLKFISPLYN